MRSEDGPDTELMVDDNLAAQDLGKRQDTGVARENHVLERAKLVLVPRKLFVERIA